MKKGMTLLMFVLAGCLFATAQSTTSSDSMKQDDSMKHDKTMKHGGGKTMSMTGCVAEKDGKYMMMNKAHPDGVMLMSSEDLKPHVGHKIKVSGMMEKMDNMSGDSMKSDDKTTMKHDDMGMMDMKVSSMKMISEQCAMPKMMDKKMDSKMDK